MRKLVAGIFICVAVALMSQDRGTGGISASHSPDFSSLEPFVRGLAMANREVTAYRMRVANLPNHKHPRPFVIVWTKEGDVAEQKEGEAWTTRSVCPGQIDVYAGGTSHSLRAVKSSLHFTLVELNQSLRDPKDLPNKPKDCENVVDFPQGGFACLMQIPPSHQVTIPKLGVNSFFIAINSGRVRNTIPQERSWEDRYREGQVIYHPGYELAVQNIESTPLALVLILPPPAEY